MAIQTAMAFEHQPSHRTKIVAFRLAPDEYERLNALAHARGMQVGEWCRDISLKFSRNPEGDCFQQAITGEMIALKDIVMNATYNFASGCRITSTAMTEIWKEAERTKRTKAQKLLRQANADQQGVPPPPGEREVINAIRVASCPLAQLSTRRVTVPGLEDVSSHHHTAPNAGLIGPR